MIIMLLLVVAFIVSAVVGVAIGGRRSSRSTASEVTPSIGADDMEPLIQDAAERWAQAHGRPETAGLVAAKLRTLHRIKYEQPVDKSRVRRWWR